MTTSQSGLVPLPPTTHTVTKPLTSTFHLGAPPITPTCHPRPSPLGTTLRLASLRTSTTPQVFRSPSEDASVQPTTRSCMHRLACWPDAVTAHGPTTARDLAGSTPTRALAWPTSLLTDGIRTIAFVLPRSFNATAGHNSPNGHTSCRTIRQPAPRLPRTQRPLLPRQHRARRLPKTNLVCAYRLAATPQISTNRLLRSLLVLTERLPTIGRLTTTARLATRSLATHPIDKPRPIATHRSDTPRQSDLARNDYPRQIAPYRND